MIKRRRGWMDCTDPIVLKIYKEVRDEAARLYPDYFEKVEPKFYIISSTRNLGKCVGIYDKDTVHNKWGYKNGFNDLRWSDGIILLSKYLKSPEAIRSCIVHEFGHYVTPGENHSIHWVRRANKIGKKFNVKMEGARAAKHEMIDFRANMAEANVKEYKVRCSCCGRIVTRRRMCSIIQNPQNWRCGNCGGKFETYKEK